MTIEQQLDNLVNSKSFIDLNNMMQLDKTNIFRILGLERYEIRHSNMLAYLLDPIESHGFDHLILRKLLHAAIKTHISISKSTSITVRREVPIIKLHGTNKWEIKPKGTTSPNNRFIDLLIIIDNGSKRTVICIENKIDAGLGDNQLYDYESAVENTYAKDNREYIFLTPDEQIPIAKAPKHDPSWTVDKWNPAGYAVIKKALITAKTKCKMILPATDVLVDNYLELLDKKIIQNNPTLKKNGCSLYLDPINKTLLDNVLHKRLTGVNKKAYNEKCSEYEEVFRLLRTVRYNIVNKNVPAIINCLKKTLKSQGIKIRKANSYNSLIAFTTNNLTTYFPPLGKDKVEYILDIRETIECISMQISTSVSKHMSNIELNDILTKGMSKSWFSINKIINANTKHNKVMASSADEHFDIILKSLKEKTITKVMFNEAAFNAFLSRVIALDNTLK